MRIALCLCGIVGGKTGKDGQGGPVDFQRCYDSCRKHILDVNNADVFLHSWSVGLEKELCGLYRPKKAIFIPQEQFATNRHLLAKEQHEEFIVKSKWYSVQEVMGLKRVYEQAQGFVYDWVMLSRFDLLWFVDFDFSKLSPGFHAANFNDPPTGKSGHTHRNRSLKEKRLLDLWFLGNSASMDKLATLYSYLPEYIPADIHKYSGASKLIDPHRYVWSHVQNVVKSPLHYTLYRWDDFELIRLKDK